MNKKASTIFIIFLLFLTLIYMIGWSSEVIESVSFSISIWKDNLFPTLFPFFVVSNLLMHYGVVDIIGTFLSYPMKKFFHLPKDCGFVLAASLFSGFPSGAKYTKDLVIEKRITAEEGARLLTFTHYSNPVFVLGMIGHILLNRSLIALWILIAHVSSGLLVGYWMNRHYHSTPIEERRYEKKQLSSQTFGELLTSSIFSSLNTMFLLLGIVTIFLILNSLLNQVFSFPPILNALVSGVLEMTQGVKLVSSLNLSEWIKAIMITAIISFGGFSVHMQVVGIISECKIKYKPFLLARILHACLAAIIVWILCFIGS